jgi:hypothetical protein
MHIVLNAIGAVEIWDGKIFATRDMLLKIV